MKSRLIFLGSEDDIEEAFLLLVKEDGTTTWQHYEFDEDDFDTTLRALVKAKEKAGVDEVDATCAVRAYLDDLSWPDMG